MAPDSGPSVRGPRPLEGDVLPDISPKSRRAEVSLGLSLLNC